MYTRLSSKELFRHPRLIVEEDRIKLSSGETTDYLRYGYPGDGAVIVCCNDQQELLMLKEYSYLPDKAILQFPMGQIEKNELPEKGALREFQEETGYQASNIVLKGSYWQHHRRSKNKAFVFAASGITSRIQNGDIIDADTLASLRVCGY